MTKPALGLPEGQNLDVVERITSHSKLKIKVFFFPFSARFSTEILVDYHKVKFCSKLVEDRFDF
jgi:hypothetical protein